jgi:arginase
MKLFLLSVPYDSGYHAARLGRGPLILTKSLAQAMRQHSHEVREVELSVNVLFPTEVSTSFEISRQVAGYVHDAKQRKEFPIVMSGNCNAAALGIISGMQNNEGVIWFDAHGDFNTPETSTSGYLDGMSLAMVTGHCWQNLTTTIPGYKAVPENKVTLIGGHDLDPLEAAGLRASAITLISATNLRQHGDEIYKSFPSVKSVYLHLDLDVLDPSFAKVNSFSQPGGLLPDELLRTLSLIKDKLEVVGIGITAYDPSMDPEQKVPVLVGEIGNMFFG